MAEGILSLVTSQERAAATIGDLVEEGASPVAFRVSIAWTVLSLIAHDLSAEPLAMFGFAVYGVILSLVLSALHGVVVAELFVWVFQRAVPSLSVNDVVGTSLVVSWAESFLVGILLARRAIGREVIACFAVLILNGLLTVALPEAPAGARPAGWYATVPGSAVIFVVYQLFLFAGATGVRRRRLRRS